MSATVHAADPGHGHAHAAAPVPYQTPGNVKMAGLGLLAVGAALFAWGLLSEPWRAWANGLIASYYFVSIAIGAAVIVALMHVSKAGWGTVVRRVPEAMTTYLPIGLLTLLAVGGLGMHELYEWSHADIVAKDHLLQHKSPLLNPTVFLGATVVIVGGWSLLTWALRRQSQRQDQTGDLKHTQTSIVLSTVFLVFFGLSITLGALLWLMSLEPHWFSTMFGVYHFAGAHVTAAAVMTLFVIGLIRGGFLPQANENHLHDLGKMMFAFSTFWAYIWLGQFLLIWYANIPEETGYFLIRYDTGWFALFALNVVVNWGVPFFALLPRPNKRSPKVLVPVACLLIFGHWLDVYLQVMPAASHFAAHHAASVADSAAGAGQHLHGPFLGPVEIGTFAMLAGLFLLVVTAMLGKAPLLPQKDPYLTESLHHHQ